MRLSAHSIATIKSRVNIVDIVGAQVHLKQKGGRYWACCPFHQEKTPSFTVSPDLNVFKCFGCGKSGDAIAFLREVDGLGYVDALMHLAHFYGISPTYDQNDAATVAYQNKESLYLIMEAASNYYTQALSKQASARQYLSDQKLQAAVLERFRIGYGGSQSIEALAGYSADQIAQAGITNNPQSTTDRFAGRLLFPIFSISGRVIAFGARRLTEDNSPKYINSAETPIYTKSNVLYGLFQAKKALKKQEMAYLVEGYTDVLAMHQAGYENTVATAGTAFTDAQGHLLKRFVNKVTVLFDGDAAGQQATLSAGNKLLSQGFETLVLGLPDKEDPHSYLQHSYLQHSYLQNSSQDPNTTDFDTYANTHTKPFLHYKADVLLRAASTAQAKARAWQQVLSSLALIPNPLDKSLSLTDLARSYYLNEHDLQQQLNMLPSPSASPSATSSSPPPSAPAAVQAPTLTGRARLEVDLLHLLMHHGTIIYDQAADQASFSLAQYLLEELIDVPWVYPAMADLIVIYQKCLSEQHTLPTPKSLIAQENQQVVDFVLQYGQEAIQVSPKWEACNLAPFDPNRHAFGLAKRTVLLYKKAYAGEQMDSLRTRLSKANPEDTLKDLYQEQKTLNKVIHQINQDIRTCVAALPV